MAARRLATTLARLRQMSLAELASRSQQGAAKWIDRLGPPGDGGLENLAARSARPFLTFELFRQSGPSGFFGVLESDGTSAAFRARLPELCQDDLVSRANRICGRRFDVLGYEGLSFGDPIDWHRDPITGRRAPVVHWSRIDALDASQIGDCKVIWELNRHQWLVPLAQAYQFTGDEQYAHTALDCLDDWSHANPYGYGINWSSSLEVAYRVIAWTWALILFRDSSALRGMKASGLLQLIGIHAAHIERYLSRYFSPNTHLTGEALGLFYVGTVFPEFPDAARWQSLGRQILVDECDRQIYSDGVYFEQATCYQRYTIDIYLHFLILAKRNNVPVPPLVADRVERMCAFMAAVCAPDGTAPQIGDADGGGLLPLVRRAPMDCRGLFAVAAVVFNREDFARAANGPAAEVLWLLGAAARRRLDHLSERTLPTYQPHSQLFEQGGYAVMCSGVPQRHHLIFDVGPLGCSVSGAHGHADLLSVQCSAFGEAYVVDPGTYSYSSDGDWRDYFRGTAAHSTVVVDGADQAEPLKPFRWSTRPSSRLTQWKSTDVFDVADAWHDGYARLLDPVIHRRRVIFIKPKYWIVVDDVSGKAEHLIEVRYQFSSRTVRLGTGLSVASPGRGHDGLWILPFASVPLERRVAEGRECPLEGWWSPDYGRRESAPVVVYATQHQLPVRIVTLLLPVRDLTEIPPEVEPLHDAAGELAGLTFAGVGETVRFDGREVVVRASRAH